MMKKSFLLIMAVFLLFVVSSPANAIPTLQVYSPQGIAGSILNVDEDTWFVSGSAFDLYVVGKGAAPEQTTTGDLGQNNKPNVRTVKTLDNVTLVVSVPDRQTGSISITPLGGGPALAALTVAGTGGPDNPNADADLDILLNPDGIKDGFATKVFLPTAFNGADNHAPAKDNIADFILFSLGSFNTLSPSVFDYNATPPGSKTADGPGMEKQYRVEYAGFDWVHFDAYGSLIDKTYTQARTRDIIGYDNKNKPIYGPWYWGAWALTKDDLAWKDSPNSHDVTAFVPAPVPEPATMLLLGSGLIGLAGFGRKRLFKKA